MLLFVGGGITEPFTCCCCGCCSGPGNALTSRLLLLFCLAVVCCLKRAFCIGVFPPNDVVTLEESELDGSILAFTSSGNPPLGFIMQPDNGFVIDCSISGFGKEFGCVGDG